MKLGLTRSDYQGLADVMKGVMPPHYLLTNVIDAAIAPVREVVVDGLSMAATTFTEALTADLHANPKLRAQLVHSIKIGGDASHDSSEKEEKSSSILMLTFGWIAPAAGLPANSTRSHRILAAAWAKESHHSVQAMCRLFAHEITKLRKDGLTLTIGDAAPVTYRFRFSVSGDMKWVRLAYGLGGCSSTFGCLYCRIEKKDIYRFLKDARLDNGYDQPRDKMRSIDFMRRQAAEAAKKRIVNVEKAKKKKEKEEKKEEKKGKENVDPKKAAKAKAAAAKKLLSVGKGAENQEWPPAWDIEPGDAPPERLHLLLCVCRIFERALAAMLHPKETCTPRGKRKQINQTMELRNNDEHREKCLRPLTIDRRPITGYTGEEWKKILGNPRLWCSLADSSDEHEYLVYSMEEFAVLFEKMGSMNDEKSAREFGEKALEWAQDVAEWCEAARSSFYLHVFATHAWRWYDLSDHCSYAMEKMGGMMKKTKRKYMSDAKTSEEKRSAKGALTSMVRVTNATNVLSPFSPLPEPKRREMYCSACGNAGHQRSSGACPAKRLRT
jgi:hypothetical protein